MSKQTTPAEAKHVRQIEVFAEAITIKQWKKQVVAGQRGQKQFTFLSDEGSYMPGGEGTAPTPLTYFVAGVAL
ncbi:MAG TPA: hypothetical protein VGA72_00400 [Anaerolineales bacterium]